MKFIIVVIAVLFLAIGSIVGKCESNTNSLMASHTIVWAGIDFALMKMIGCDSPQVKYNFIVPDYETHYHFRKMFPELLIKWNQQFIDEKIDAISTIMQREVNVDIDGINARNLQVTTNQIIITSDYKNKISETNITPEDIVNEVRSLQLAETNGLGLVFIVDRFARGVEKSSGKTAMMSNDAFGDVYVVFFDIATRDILVERKETNHISTAGNFQNFYFGPIKDAASVLKKYHSASVNTLKAQSLKGHR